MNYYYSAFGLMISSEIECPLLAVDPSPSDVNILYRSTPDKLVNPQAVGKNFQINSNRILLNIENVARYLIHFGQEIIVEPYSDAASNIVRVFLLGSAMGAVLHQRGRWPLHGSAIATDRGAVIFVGVSGNGKSTLAGAFHKRGYRTISDDVSALSLSRKGIAQLWPGYPRIKLCADATTKLGIRPSTLLRFSREEDKFELPLSEFSLDAVEVYAIYVLETGPHDYITLIPISGFDKIKELTINTYRLHFLQGMHCEQRLFHQAQILARQARIVRVIRPQHSFQLDELVDLIERDLSQ